MTKTIKRREIGPRPPKATKGLAPSMHSEGQISTARQSILHRMQTAVADVVEMSADDRILEALSTATSIDALIHLVGAPGVVANAAARTDDPLRAARARATRQRLDLVKAEGGCIGVSEVAERLRLGRAAVDKRRKAGRLLAIDIGSRTVAYPSWQFGDGETLVGLETVLDALTVNDAFMRIGFFLTSDPDLDATPLQALRAGRVDEVASAAERFGRMGDDR